MQQIHEEMTIEDIFTQFPQKSQMLAQAMSNAGLHCVGCSAATWETLKAGMLSHGKKETEIQELIQKLNHILEEKQDLSSITLTEKAAQKFQEICQAQGKAGYALRIDHKPAGCSGFEHVLDFSEKAKDTDVVFSSHGVNIYVEKSKLDQLKGCLIDFEEGLHGQGFKISNPNARSSCGCGHSHNY